MAINIPLGFQQESLSTQNESVAFQDWGPVPSVSNLSFNLPSVTINNIFFTFEIKDIIGTPIAGNNTQFRLIVFRSYGSPNPTTTDWFSIPELPNLNSLHTVNITQNGQVFNTTFQFSSMASLPVTLLIAQLTFIIQGRVNNTSSWQNLSTHNHLIKMTITNFSLTWSPQTVSLIHFFGNTPLPYFDVTITGQNWLLKRLDNFLIPSSSSQDVTIEETQIGNQTAYKVIGSDTATVRWTLNEVFNEQQIPNALYAIGVFSSENVVAGGIPVMISTIGEGLFEVSPSVLNFNAIKDITEPEQLYIIANAISPISVSWSPWLIVTQGTILINEVETDVYLVRPIATSNMEAGIYEGQVMFSATINNTQINIPVTVNYNLGNFVTSPYLNNRFAFTLDNKGYEFNTLNENTYFQIEALISYYDFFSNEEKQIIIPKKLPLFKKKGQLFMGKLIHKILARFNTPNENYFQCKAAKLRLSLTEKDSQGNEYNTGIIEQVFLPGISDNVMGKKAFLDYNPNTIGITKNGFYFLNMSLPEGVFGLKVYKNEELINEESIAALQEGLYTKKIKFNSFTPGDRIDYYLVNNTSGRDFITLKKFVIMPDGRYSNFIYWENEFLLQSVLECTGSLALTSDYESNNQKLFKNLVEVIEILETKKTDRFEINTGWMIQNADVTIDSLMRAKRVWVFNKTNELIELRPLVKSQPKFDSERALISFDLEFTINRSKDEKTYSF